MWARLPRQHPKLTFSRAAVETRKTIKRRNVVSLCLLFLQKASTARRRTRSRTTFSKPLWPVVIQARVEAPTPVAKSELRRSKVSWKACSLSKTMKAELREASFLLIPMQTWITSRLNWLQKKFRLPKTSACLLACVNLFSETRPRHLRRRSLSSL